MSRIALTIVSVLLLSASLSGVVQAGPVAADPTSPAVTSAAEIPVERIPRTLRGVVVTWRDGRLARIPFAHVGTGLDTVQADEFGRFTIPAAIRTTHVNIVAPGYEVIRRVTRSDYVVAFVKPLDVRAIYLPYDQLRNPSVLSWALGLARDGVVSAFVIDVKNEQGAVLPLVANQTAIDLGAVGETFTDVEGFLRELDRLGVYRIARVVTFLDGWLALGRPATAIRDFDGSVFRDGIDLAWTNPFSDLARLHNIEIGVNAARFFDEIQYDYVRLPTEQIELRNRVSAAQRSAIIAQFAQEAAEAVHAVGAAIAIDTFGQTTIISHDDGIGQVLEEMAPFLDYYSPMVYPSTWTPGWFGLDYPPADPFTVVLSSVEAAVLRLDGYDIVVRPWLQDFHDYQVQKLPYNAFEVGQQIDASGQAGGSGFMLWDPSLNYELGLLRDLAAGGIAVVSVD